LNRGGNGDLRHALVRELVRAEDEDTKLFVLTWRGAFSATQFILDDLARLTDAVLIGEPASSRPNSYGDSYRDTLPNSGLTIRTSIRWHQIGHTGNRPWTPVDIATPYRFADYAAGRDPALETALNDRPRPSLADLALGAAETSGGDGVRRVFEAYRADPANRYLDLQTAVIAAGLRLHQARRTAHAVDLLAAASARDPSNADLTLVQAQFADLAGDRETARKAAARTLELDPDNRSARSLLERLHAPAG
jgi:tetratricopeptide (TPR) repeat protein